MTDEPTVQDRIQMRKGVGIPDLESRPGDDENAEKALRQFRGDRPIQATPREFTPEPTWTELARVEPDAWPFEDSIDGLAKAQVLAPDNALWVRMRGSVDAFVLLESDAQ